MNKKLISLFAACSMVATVSVGLVQTAYAAEPNVRIEVTDGATDTQKVLTFYYEGAEGMNSLQGELSFEGGDVTIDALTVTINAKYKGADKDSAVLYFAEEEDGGASSEDGSFATATITVPGDVDITANFEVQAFENADFEDFTDDIGTVSVTIPKKADPTPAREFSATKGDTASFSTDDGYDANMVAAQYTLTIENGSYDLADAKYNGASSKGITAADGSAVASTVITGAPSAEAIVFVVIEGTSDLAELDNVVFE